MEKSAKNSNFPQKDFLRTQNFVVRIYALFRRFFLTKKQNPQTYFFMFARAVFLEIWPYHGHKNPVMERKQTAYAIVWYALGFI